MVQVVDTLPAGLTATALSGAGWSCTLGTLTCTRGDPLAASGSYPDITLTVTVSDNAPASLTNSASVSGGGDDILIAVSSSYDDASASNQAALCGIQAEWLRTDLGYDMRLAHLSGAVNGANWLKPGSTVFDDTNKDKLKGESDQDWFLLSQSGGGAVDTSDRTRDEVSMEL
jgi:hypothetical protein